MAVSKRIRACIAEYDPTPVELLGKKDLTDNMTDKFPDIEQFSERITGKLPVIGTNPNDKTKRVDQHEKLWKACRVYESLTSIAFFMRKRQKGKKEEPVEEANNPNSPIMANRPESGYISDNSNIHSDYQINSDNCEDDSKISEDQVLDSKPSLESGKEKTRKERNIDLKTHNKKDPKPLKCSIPEIKKKVIGKKEERNLLVKNKNATPLLKARPTAPQKTQSVKTRCSESLKTVTAKTKYIAPQKSQSATKKKKVRRSDTKRINELFRQKSLTNSCWTRTKSATLAINVSDNATLNRKNANEVRCEESPAKKQLVAASNKTCPNCDTILHFAASNGELDIVKFYVEKNLYINQQNKNLNTGLHCAVYYGHGHIVEVLLQHNPGIDAQNIDGDTALHIAVTTGQYFIIEKLIKHGADPNKQNNNGNAPIHLATHKGCLQSVQALIKAGARLDLKNKAGNTPIHTAISVCSNPNIVISLLQAVNRTHESVPPNQCKDLVVEQMIDNLTTMQSLLWRYESDRFEDIDVPKSWRKSFNINTEGEDKKSVLCRTVNGLLARLMNSESMKAPYIINMKNELGDTVLHRAVRYCPKLLSMLLDSCKLDAKIRNCHGETALHIAVKTSSLKCQRLLIKKCKRLLDIADNRYNTPLHWAAEWGYCRSIVYLLPTDYKKDVQNYVGNTALHLAILNQHYCIVWALIQNNANVNVPNKEGDLPLHCATRTGNIEIFQLILEKSREVIDQKNLVGDTALLMSVKLHSKDGPIAIINMLLRHSADVNIQDKGGNTALHLSILLKLDTLSYQLIRTNKTLTNIRNNNGDTVIHLVTKTNNIDMMRSLVGWESRDYHIEDRHGYSALCIAIRRQQLKMAVLLLNRTWMVDITTYEQLCT